MLKTALKRKFRNKRGSSLPMVLAIGLVLVIWVMGLSPIVVTQGKASIDVQNQEEDYLQSRSAIEFTKGELVNMVARGTPSTFAVVKDDDSYVPYRWDSPEYDTCVSAQAFDKDDVPAEGEAGDKVAAICAVWKEPSERMYRIQITTYNEGESGLSYNTTYTPPVLSQQVYPESYKKTEALPMSDFILVDGHLGNNTIWHSPLTYVEEDATSPKYDHTSYINVTTSGSTVGKFTSYKTDFKETLLPASEGADAGSYPAVFKVTAEATDLNRPDEEANTPDNLTFVSEPDAPALKVESKTFTEEGRYYNKYYTLKVTLNNLGSNARYGYSTSANPGSVSNWQTSPTFSLGRVDNGTTFYFYCYIVGHAEGRTLYGDSKVAVLPVKVLKMNASQRSTFDSNKRYIMCNSNSMFYVSNSALSTQSVSNGSFLLYSDDMAWKIEDGKLFSIWDPAYNRYTYLNFESNYSITRFYLGNSYESFVYEKKDNRYVIHRARSSYYLSTGSNYCTNSTNNAGLSFYEVTPPASGTAPTRPSNSVTVAKVTNISTLAQLKEDYKTNCQTKGISSVTVYVVNGAAAGKYDVYATGTYNGKSWFGKLDSGVEIPDYIPVSGYGISGRALYFMASDYAINTNEEEIVNLSADLLVIRSELDEGNGTILLQPYSCSHTLAFFLKSTGEFKAYNFYQIPPNEDGSPRELKEVTEEQAIEWLVCDTSGDYTTGSAVEYIDDDPEKGVESIIFPDYLITIQTSGDYDYPIINFDIAYATDEQLAHVVSGRAARWVDANGKLLAKEDRTPNGWYVVCPYVTEVASGDITRSANRILMKSDAESLDIAGKIKLVSRYWSIDAKQITQMNNSAEFKLYCLTSKENSIEEGLSWLSSFLGDIDYSSDTMQVDYEQATTISRLSGNVTMPAQICRYENGTNLFGSVSPEDEKEDLRVEYEIDKINTAFNSEAVNATIVERYMHLYGEDTDTLYIGRDWLKCKLQLYSNYISFDSSVKKIHVDAGFSGFFNYDYSELIINSQETGYTSDEYLYLFTTSAADTYTGTMLYFEDDVVVEYAYWGSSIRHTISEGFYYINAGGKNVLERKNGECVLENYYIPKEDLVKYTKYIDPDNGSMSSAYVNPGFETDEETFGGFGGGSVN